MGIVIDLILLITVIIAVISGARKGFVRSAMNIISLLCALISGWYFYPALGAKYYDNIFIKYFSDDVLNSIEDIVNAGIEKIDISTLFTEKPAPFLDILSRYGVDISGIENAYNALVNAGAQNVTETISTRIAEPVAAGLSNLLAFLTIFVGVIIILKIVTFILDLIFKLPVLNALNRAAGIVFGLICGGCYAYIFAAIIITAIPILITLFPDVFNDKTAASSVILSFLAKYNVSDVLKLN